MSKELDDKLNEISDNVDPVLKELLENVQDSYYNFVIGSARIAQKADMENELIDYIKNHQKANSSEITEFIYESGMCEVSKRKDNK